MRRALVIFATLVLLWAVVSQLNHALSPWHLYFWVGGLFVTHAALTLPLRSGVFASLLAGMLCDASSSLPFGTHSLLFAAAHVVIFNVRDRVPRDETLGRVIIALLANFALFAVLSSYQIFRQSALVAAWPRMASDLVCSQLLIALVAPWFFSLQAAALEISRPLTTRFDRDID